MWTGQGKRRLIRSHAAAQKKFKKQTLVQNVRSAAAHYYTIYGKYATYIKAVVLFDSTLRTRPAAGPTAGAPTTQAPLVLAGRMSGAEEVKITSPFTKKKELFDAEDFDAVKLINQIYPDGAPIMQHSFRLLPY